MTAQPAAQFSVTLKVRLAMEAHIQQAANHLTAFLQKHSFLI